MLLRYVATNDTKADYGTALAKRGFRCFSSHCWALTSTAGIEDLADNFFIFAVEMQIVDAATVCVRTFNDSMPWYRASLTKPSHHLMDRSMHDYVFGFSATGTSCSWPESPLVSLVNLDAGMKHPRGSRRCAEGEERRPKPCDYSIAVFEGERRDWWELPACIWPMEVRGGTCEGTFELLEPTLRNVSSGMSVWTEYFGALAAFTDSIAAGLSRRSTLYGFENVSEKHRNLTSGVVPRRGAVFCYASMGSALLRDRHGTFEIVAGQYCVVPAPLRIELHGNTRLVAIHTHPFEPLRTMGGPIESKGRLRYVDGCSDTLLLAPPRLSDPCLNFLHFPPNIHQTLHTHPSVRCGLIASGAGYCLDAELRKLELQEGMVWAIPKDTVHSFHTAESKQELNVIAFHPDSDWGPMDEDHPMLNRTWVDGKKIDNCAQSHRNPDMLRTDQSLAQQLAQHLSQLAPAGKQGLAATCTTAPL